MIEAIRFPWIASDFAYLLVTPFESNNDIIFSLVPVIYCDIFVCTLEIWME